MRLLNVKTRCLEEFYGDKIPPYAILSHTWGVEGVTFQDLSREDHKQKHGYKKIEGCCQAAAEQRISYVWCDTICIDKSSSAELSEAINSMFKWYEASEVCFVFLEDLPPKSDPFPLQSAFRRSRWWTRGWTLQELLAPHHLVFFDSTWERVFTPEMGQDLFKKITLPTRSQEVLKRPKNPSEDPIQTILQQMRYGLVTEITGIPVAILVKNLQLSEVSAACKFAWASQRLTTRVEDRAYCLMGLLDVNMPLLYGEGDKAFVRLQEAVIGSSDDISPLAWGCGLGWEAIEKAGYHTIFARSPAAFRGYPGSNHQHTRQVPKTHSTVTGHGLHVELPLLLIDARNRVWIGVIEEFSNEDTDERGIIAVVLRQKDIRDTQIFERARGCPVLKIANFHRRNQVSRGFISKAVYLQDGGIASSPTVLISSRRLPSLLSWFSEFTGKSIKRNQYTAELAIFTKNLRNVGYTLSSRYPPMDHDQASLFAPDARNWELSGRQIIIHESPFEYLLCQGPGNELFYFIVANAEGHSVAVKVHIRYKPPYIDSYKVALSQFDLAPHATALEYAYDTGFGTHTVDKLSSKMRWSDSVNPWSPTSTKIHVTACPSEQRLSKKHVRFAQCSLVWSGGWVSEAEQHLG
jgi:hypothetical protein